MPAVVKTSTGVTVAKPFWMSKKLILTAIAFGVAVYQAWTGNWDGLTPEQLTAQIVKVVTIIGPIVSAVLAIAHVDGKSQAAALVTEGLKVLAGLDKPDATSDTVRPS